MEWWDLKIIQSENWKKKNQKHKIPPASFNQPAQNKLAQNTHKKQTNK